MAERSICVSIFTEARLTALLILIIILVTKKVPEKCRESAGKVPMSEQEQRIYKFILKNASITTAQTMKLLGVKQRRAREILAKMAESKWLRKEGVSRSTIYVINTEDKKEPSPCTQNH